MLIFFLDFFSMINRLEISMNDNYQEYLGLAFDGFYSMYISYKCNITMLVVGGGGVNHTYNNKKDNDNNDNNDNNNNNKDNVIVIIQFLGGVSTHT
jgi:hypothetical protein